MYKLRKEVYEDTFRAAVCKGVSPLAFRFKYLASHNIIKLSSGDFFNSSRVAGGGTASNLLKYHLSLFSDK